MKKIIMFFLPLMVFGAVPDFEILQGSKSAIWKTLEREDLEEVQFYKNLYERQFVDPYVLAESTRIPHVFHFIWLGPRPFPYQSIKNLESWKDYHPEWVFKFWTDDAARACPIEGMEKHLISELELSYLAPFLGRTKNWGEKSDMLRYEILFREGGVYVDHDVLCFRSFSALNDAYDFYAGLDTPHLAEGQRTQIYPGNCLIGAIPHHPLVQVMLEKIAERFDRVEKEFPNNQISRVMHRTFLAFTEAVRENSDDPSYKNILFPALYFFPDLVYGKKIRKKLNLQNVPYASHAFSGLWTDNPPTEVTALKKKQREVIKKLHRRLNLLTYATAISLLFSAFLLLFHLRKSVRN